MAEPKCTHWAFYKGEWRHCWLQNTDDGVKHEVLTSPGPDGKLDCWIHEDKKTIYTDFELFAMGINPTVNKHTKIESAIPQ